MGTVGCRALLALVAIVWLVSSCSRVLGEDESYNANPCIAHYHPGVLAERARSRGALSTWSDPTPLNYRPKAAAFDPRKVDCRVYDAMLGFDDLPATETDAFAIEVARPFFADAASAEVLHLELQNILPRRGKITVAYDIHRADLNGPHEEASQLPSSETTYELAGVSHFSRSFGDGHVENGVLLTVTLPRDGGDTAALVARIKAEHPEAGTEHAEIRMNVASRACRLCSRKEIFYFF